MNTSIEEGPNSNKIVFEKNRKKAYTFFVLIKESCKVQGFINMWFCIYESIFGLIWCYHGNVMGLFPSWSWALLLLTYQKNVGMLELIIIIIIVGFCIAIFHSDHKSCWSNRSWFAAGKSSQPIHFIYSMLPISEHIISVLRL